MADHGTPKRYRKGCQCGECLLAWSLYIDHYRQAKTLGMDFADYRREMGCVTDTDSWIQEQVRSTATTAVGAKTKPEPVNL